ncbi:MAG TPA: TolC family protein [Bryobacteraceae bacterium]|nr:TolC family protein [Bryobacteraceae bacterium]
MDPSPNVPFTTLLALLLVSAGCAVGPHYKRLSAAAPPAFKEQPPVNFKEAEAAGWKQSQPGDAYSKGRWRELYNDVALNALEKQVSVSSQNVLQAEAQYQQAKAAVSVARTALFPAVTTAPAASAATAQSANVANARLLCQAELAQDYFGHHGNDGEAELLTRTKASDEGYLTLTRNRVSAGVASDLDVAQAESQLSGVQSQMMDLGVQRAAFESELPERRPDIAGAERQVAAANEQIGIAGSAFYPNLSLTGSAQVESSSVAKWFTWPSRSWSVGPQLAETLFDAGRRRVVTEQRAAYDATVAACRETELTAMQQVENNLAALRIPATEADKVQQTAVTLLTRRLTASVLLIEALGGGWNASQLPAR